MRNDGMIEELLRLADALEDTARDLEKVAERARAFAESGRDGRPWREVVTPAERPLIVARLTEILDRLGEHSASFRRTGARVLHDEGLSHERIAFLFGVSRQRVSALLATRPRPAGDPGGD